jgi:hypothetical protein
VRNYYLAAVAAVTTVVSIGAPLTAAQARDYPFCIKGESWPNTIGDCSFETYQQCLAMASGGRAYCDANPFFDSHSIQAGVSKKRSRRTYQGWAS